MTAIQKQVIGKIKRFYESAGMQATDFSMNEEKEVDGLIAAGYLVAGAFERITTGEGMRHFLKYGPNPFTQKALEEESTSRYQKFRNGTAVTVTRDAFVVIAFILSVLLTLEQLFHLW